MKHTTACVVCDYVEPSPLQPIHDTLNEQEITFVVFKYGVFVVTYQHSIIMKPSQTNTVFIYFLTLEFKERWASFDPMVKPN